MGSKLDYVWGYKSKQNRRKHQQQKCCNQWCELGSRQYSNGKIHNRMLSGKIPVNNFIEELIVPQAKDFIDNYDPDILWFDGEWQRSAEYYRTPDIVAYFYNKAEGRKEVVSNDRLGRGTREVHGDFYTSETDDVVEKMEEPWEENRSMSESYGYNRTDSLENYLSADELIQMFVRIVAKGGHHAVAVAIEPQQRAQGIAREHRVAHRIRDRFERTGRL